MLGPDMPGPNVSILFAFFPHLHHSLTHSPTLPILLVVNLSACVLIQTIFLLQILGDIVNCLSNKR